MPYKINVDLPSVNGNADYAVITGKDDIFPFENGKRSETRTGVKLTLALQKSRLTPLVVKFDHDPLPKVSDEQIKAATENCKFMFVQVPDCEVNLYSSNNGGIGMSATAQTAQIVSLEK